MTPTRAATPREKVSRPAIGGVRVSMSLRGRDEGPSAVLPYLVRIMGEVGELDRVHVEDDRMAAEGVRWLAGQGRFFEARATLHPVAGAVPRWDVALEVRLVRGPKLEAGAAVSLWLEPGLDPGWLIPGLFYGENRPAGSEARYPRFLADTALETAGNDPFAASAWSFRADRAATPVVWATDGQVGAALATTEASEAGPTGLGFAADPARTEISLFFPFREEPVTYVGSAIPALSDVRMHSWTPGRWVRLGFRVYLGEPRHDAFTSVLRDLHRWLAATSPTAPWVAVPVAADLAAEGLLRWHYRPEAPALYETAAFERHFDGRADEHGDRAAMHVAWLSGAPPAYALLA
ncbi:MAG: hypothetical protein M3135_02315, partial [Actinomycetota bacterium]|nr:hypothetical protein [Actinomycetota bacterium]